MLKEQSSKLLNFSLINLEKIIMYRPGLTN